MYTPYTWTNGEVITAEKLNHAEEGIEGAYEEVANVLPEMPELEEGEIVVLEAFLNDGIVKKSWELMYPYSCSITGYANGDVLEEELMTRVADAVTAGVPVIFRSEESDLEIHNYFARTTIDGGFIFAPLMVNGTSASSYYYEIASDGTVTRKGGVN